jgi:dihydroorotate dehydrogenase electron transfer subunit
MSGHRGTIFLESATVLEHGSFDGDQFILRLRAPQAAAAARPGSFAHLRCDETVPMRRPLSIMRADAGEGWIELLYKPVGPGLRRLTDSAPGNVLSVLAPIGNGFGPDPSRPRVLAIGGGVGIPPVLFLAESLAGGRAFQPIVLMGSEVPFPFELAPAALAAAGPGARWAGSDVRALAALEALGVPSLTASNAGLPGAIPGFVTDVARAILGSLDDADLAATQIAACGPGPMLRATAALAADFDLPCQLALEEYMACGVGGCAGCTVPVHGPDGIAMRRVCVDGPVFEASQIYPPAAG